MKKRIFLLVFCAVLIFVSSFVGCKCEHTTLIWIERVESTCTTSGIDGHFKCSKCDARFVDAFGETQIKKNELFLKTSTAHNFIWAVNEHDHSGRCVDCNKLGQQGAHQITDVEKKYASYTKSGNEAGKVCSTCGYISEGAEEIPATSLFTQKTFGNLNYCQYMPQISQGKKVPLVLFLHGSGERGSNNEAQLKNAVLKVVFKGSTSKFMDAVVIAPQCPKETYWTNADSSGVNYKISTTPETETIKLVVALIKQYSSYDYIDSSKVYVIGVSMGGFATWDLLARHSNLFAAGVPICGGGPTDAIQTLKNIPIYTFHGQLDPLVPYEGTKNMVTEIKNAGGTKIIFKGYEEGYHDIWNDAITFKGDEKLPPLEDWLFSQKK